MHFHVSIQDLGVVVHHLQRMYNGSFSCNWLAFAAFLCILFSEHAASTEIGGAREDGGKRGLWGGTWGRGTLQDPVERQESRVEVMLSVMIWFLSSNRVTDENKVETGFAHETCTRLNKDLNMTKMVSVEVAITVKFPKFNYLFYSYSPLLLSKISCMAGFVSLAD